ncbi:MAG TPA: citrate lyase acyl carrier protein [Bacilli bacterium]|jgi:citrate lyase subunit gamma (acyl carrier protein)|nr:citrate lyase acyl carrier protein [Acholeplasmataceae bacterium]HNZ74273.1 citrate lyase acyl carrier protein [Bacilli bacterium]
MKGQAGTLESNDCLITVEKSSKLEIIINSPVAYLYEDEIKKTILEVLKNEKQENLKIVMEDKGALDYTIRARLIAAIRRMK